MGLPYKVMVLGLVDYLRSTSSEIEFSRLASKRVRPLFFRKVLVSQGDFKGGSLRNIAFA